MDRAALRFTRTHEWAFADGDVVTVGLTDFAVNALTDLVYIELPAVGNAVQAGTSFGEVESVKAVSDLYAPISGEVLESNTGLADDLDVLSEDPFERGWLIRLKVSDASVLNDLMDEEAYETYCESQSH